MSIRHQAMVSLNDLKLAIGLLENTQSVTIGEHTAVFNVENGTEAHRAASVAGERDILERFLDDLRPTDVVWDVGAAIGTYSCFAGQIAENLVSFEPHPGNAKRLAENLALNGVASDIRQVALSAEDGAVGFESDGGVGAGTHFVTPNAARTVRARRGDDTQPRPSVVKIDVEGHEKAVLDGMAESLEWIRVAYVEVHPQLDVDPQAVRKVFDSAGFWTEWLRSDREEWFLRAVRPRGDFDER
jgi:FkbM family methyltransferase